MRIRGGTGRRLAKTSSSRASGVRPCSTNHSRPRTALNIHEREPEQQAERAHAPVGGGLAVVGEQGAALLVGVGPDVHAVGQVLASGVGAARSRCAVRPAADQASQRSGGRPVGSGSGRRSPRARAGVPAEHRRTATGPVHLEVVGVTVAAGTVVDGQRVGALRSSRAASGAAAASTDRAANVPGVRPAGPARVRRSRAARPGRTPRTAADASSSRHPSSRDRSAARVRGGGEPGCPVRRDREHHPVSLGGRAGEGAPGVEDLVVGVGVEGHEGEEHPLRLGRSTLSQVALQSDDGRHTSVFGGSRARSGVRPVTCFSLVTARWCAALLVVLVPTSAGTTWTEVRGGARRRARP